MPSPEHVRPPVLDFTPHVIAIRREVSGYGIRFGLSEAEDALKHGPVFSTLPEALAWIDALDDTRALGHVSAKSPVIGPEHAGL